MRILLGASLLLLVLSGCVENPPDRPTAQTTGTLPQVEEDPATAPVITSPPSITLDASPPVAVLRAGELLRWQGTCPCPPLAFAMDDEWEGWLEVRVHWDGTKTAGYEVDVESPGASTEAGRGFDDRLARLFEPVAGAYAIHLKGSGDYVATARLGTTQVPATGPLLPNLVELVIEGPRIGSCDEVESTEQGATKCMRFGNGVGNPGHGPVQIRLTIVEALQALAPLDGRFAQEIRNADGTIEAHEVGPASFHVSHSHWHYDGLAAFELYAVDEATGLRGDLASSHHKAGFCFLDWGEMEEPVTQPAEQERAESDCLVPGLTSGTWTNGISRGWYDFYWSDLTDQYVDVAGLPDGVYELVASADPLDTLDELDETDNQSSLLIRLAGNSVEVLEERAHYRVQEKDDE